MAITVADNFSYQGKKPLDGRDTFTTLAAMKAYAEASVYDGCLSYCDEDGKRYEFKSTNTVDPTTGKWREYSSGGGGETYSDFTGATASIAGAHGLVPAPSAGDDGRVLFGNGTWGALINSPNELPVLFDERGTEYQVGWYVNSSGLKKPVYEKSFNLSLSESVSGVHSFEKNFDVSGLSIDVLINAYGVWTRHNSSEITWYVFGSSESQYGQSTLRLSANKQTMNMLFTSEGTDNQRVILQYTKTTD